METPCVICQYDDIAHKQGDSILLMFRVLNPEGDPFADFTSLNIKVVLLGSRAIFRKYEYQDGSWGADDEMCSVDDDGYIAIRLGSETTEEMEGRYVAQFVLGKDEDSVQSPIVRAVEIIPSVVHKIA